MTIAQDANKQAEPGESLKDGAPSKISSTPGQDALSDSSLDEVSGGSWPFNSTASASYGAGGPGG